MNNDEVILSIDHITKEFSGTPVLQGVSFDVHAGEVIGLVGENGAGKTTLMSILFGMPVIAETGGYGLRPNLPYALLNPSLPHRVGIDWLVCGQRLVLPL